MEKTNSQAKRNVNLMITSADAFCDLSKQFLVRVGNDQYSHERAVRDLGGLISSATNLLFAIEIYLKALRILSDLNATDNHDLIALYKGLPKTLKDSIESQYEKNRQSFVNAIAALELAVSSRIPDSSEIEELNKRPTEKNRSIESVLRRNKNAYQTWRYLHEIGDTQKIITVEYESKYLMLAANVFREHAVMLYQQLHN